MMFAAALLAVLAAMGLVLARALLGPTIYDRILALNSFGTKTVLLIALYGFLTGRPGLSRHRPRLRAHQLRRHHCRSQVFRIRRSGRRAPPG